ncbi:hypothetical protein AGMMS49942_20930 [Spirochaetia bacterium]|nr:hypothetical protein AGMMS49942_20930 [Spirochaetia bacterium]
MKRYSSMTAVLALMLAGALALTGCPKTTGDDDLTDLTDLTDTTDTTDITDTTDTTVDKSALQAALTAAKAPSIYWVKTTDLAAFETALTAFETAITTAQAVYNNAAATQTEVDSAKDTLATATATFTTQHPAATNPVTVLAAIKAAYNSGNSPGTLGTTGAGATPVTIIVSGTVSYSSDAGSSAWLYIVGTNAYPPIVLQGAAGGGTLNAAGSSKRVLYIGGNNKVTLGANLTLTGGTSDSSGGGVHVSGVTFTMTGGTISGNTATDSSGGGVAVDNSGTFIMSGGTISGNTATNTGGGVFVNTGAAGFTKTGGTIYGNSGGATANTATNGNSGHNGHAVFWWKSDDRKKVDTDVTGNLSTADPTTGWTAAPPTS